MPTVPMLGGSPLPAEAQKLADEYADDRTKIQQEIDAKLEARRQVLIKSLQTVQDDLAKAGKLDEAIAVRDHIRQLECGVDPMNLRRFGPSAPMGGRGRGLTTAPQSPTAPAPAMGVRGRGRGGLSF